MVTEARKDSQKMIRKQVYVAPEQQRKLRELARWWDCTEAEVIRQAIDRLPTPDTSLDELVAERLRRAGLLAPPPGYDPEYDNIPEGPEGDEWEETEEEWLKTQPPAGLVEAVLEERRSSW